MVDSITETNCDEFIGKKKGQNNSFSRNLLYNNKKKKKPPMPIIKKIVHFKGFKETKYIYIRRKYLPSLIIFFFLSHFSRK